MQCTKRSCVVSHTGLKESSNQWTEAQSVSFSFSLSLSLRFRHKRSKAAATQTIQSEEAEDHRSTGVSSLSAVTTGTETHSVSSRSRVFKPEVVKELLTKGPVVSWTLICLCSLSINSERKTWSTFSVIWKCELQRPLRAANKGLNIVFSDETIYFSS